MWARFRGKLYDNLAAGVEHVTFSSVASALVVFMTRSENVPVGQFWDEQYVLGVSACALQFSAMPAAAEAGDRRSFLC